jgi:hypothetical protein
LVGFEPNIEGIEGLSQQSAIMPLWQQCGYSMSAIIMCQSLDGHKVAAHPTVCGIEGNGSSSHPSLVTSVLAQGCSAAL